MWFLSIEKHRLCVFPTNGSLSASLIKIGPRDRPVTMVDLYVESTRLTVQPLFFRSLCPKHPNTS